MKTINKLLLILSIISFFGVTQLKAQCTASFSYIDNGNGNYSFTNTSTGSNWSNWYFGNGSSNSNSATVTNTYLTNGLYTVYLSVGDSITGCSDSLYQTITVTSAPPCNVIAGFSSVDNGGGFYIFTSTTTGSSSYSNTWDFGDGFTGTSYNTVPAWHTYTTNGNYTVTLTAQDSITGCTNTTSLNITVTSVIPCNVTASFTSMDNGNGNYSFNSTLTGATAPYNYSWNFGNGSTSTIANPSYTYTTNQNYYVSLTVTDSNACTAIYSDSTLVTSVPPCNLNSNFTSTDNGNGNYSFTNSSTGNINNYYWSFGDGTSSTLSNPTHTFVSNGTFITQLIVSDSSNLCSDIYQIIIPVSGVVNPVPCNAAFIITPDSINVGNVIVFNTSTGNNLSYFWNFGDGSTSTQQFPNHTFNGSGPFNLCLTVTDSLTGGTCSSYYCDSIDSGGLVFKLGGFSMSVVAPTYTGLNNTPSLVAGLTIYPNPFKNSLNIELNLLEQTTLIIFVTDILGNRVSEINTRNVSLGENKFTWNATDFSNGIYLLNIRTNNSLNVEKLILNR